MSKKLQENPDKIQVIYINSRTESLMEKWHTLMANFDYLDEEDVVEFEELNSMFNGKAHIYSDVKLSSAEEYEYKKEVAEQNKLHNEVFCRVDWVK